MEFLVSIIELLVFYNVSDCLRNHHAYFEIEGTILTRQIFLMGAIKYGWTDQP